MGHLPHSTTWQQLLDVLRLFSELLYLEIQRTEHGEVVLQPPRPRLYLSRALPPSRSSRKAGGERRLAAPT